MTNKKVVITRPKIKGVEFAEILCRNFPELNMDSFIFEPMMEIKYLSVELSNLDDYDGSIVTSSYARDIIPASYPCYRVGDYAPTAKDIAEKIIYENQGKNLRLLYIRGADIAYDMKGELEAADHNIDEVIVYGAVASSDFSKEFFYSLKEGEVFAVYFFSKRTAEIFVGLAKNLGVLNDLKGIKALCISSSMIECLCSVFGENIEVADAPNIEGMVRVVNY